MFIQYLSDPKGMYNHYLPRYKEKDIDILDHHYREQKDGDMKNIDHLDSNCRIY